MTRSEMEAFATEFGPRLRDFVADALRPVVERLRALEQGRAADKADLAAAISKHWANDNGKAQ
jgi:hypothetical protein